MIDRLMMSDSDFALLVDLADRGAEDLRTALDCGDYPAEDLTAPNGPAAILARYAVLKGERA